MLSANIEVKIVGFLDGDGITQAAVFTDWCDTIVVGGRTKHGIYEQFESEAFCLQEWCSLLGFNYLRGASEVNFELEEV